jgi:hypothetical protein
MPKKTKTGTLPTQKCAEHGLTEDVRNPMLYLESLLKLWACLGIDTEICVRALSVALVSIILDLHPDPEQGFETLKKCLDECFAVGARMRTRQNSFLSEKSRQKEH